MSAAEVDALAEGEVSEVLDAWVRARRVELPEELAKVGKKANARLARKALYRLKSSGVGVVETAGTEKAPQPVAKAAALSDEDFPSVITSLVGTGEFGVFFARAARTGLEVFQGVISDELGILQLESVEASRGDYRRRIKGLDEPGAVPVIRTTQARISKELRHALALNDLSKTTLPEEIQALVQRMGLTPQLAPVEIPPPDSIDLESAPAGAALHADADIAEWLPSEPALRALAAQIETVRTDTSLDAAKRTAAFREQAVAAAQTFFTPEVRKRYASRLWLMAELFQASKRPGQAELDRQEARRLAHTQVPSAFGQRMFTKAIDAMVKANDASEAAARANLNRPGALSAPRLFK